MDASIQTSLPIIGSSRTAQLPLSQGALQALLSTFSWIVSRQVQLEVSLISVSLATYDDVNFLVTAGSLSLSERITLDANDNLKQVETFAISRKGAFVLATISAIQDQLDLHDTNPYQSSLTNDDSEYLLNWYGSLIKFALKHYGDEILLAGI